MGLSNEERLSGLYYDIDNMVQIAERIKGEDCKKLIGYVDQLWHALLGKNCNAGHWIIGSSAGNEVTWGTVSSWGIAINHHCRGLLDETEDPFKKDSEIFDAFDGFLDIEGLLGQAGDNYKAIFQIFAFSEQAVYHLRRYEDELLKDLGELSKIVSDIQGECFRLFKENDVYARAYVLSVVTKMLYANEYPYQKEKWDPLTRFLEKSAGHHDLSRMMQPRDGDLKTLALIHAALLRAKKKGKLDLLMRTQAFLTLSGRRFHYDHKFKELLVALKGKISKAGVADLKKLFNKDCKGAHEADEKESQKDYEQEKESPLTIYGFMADRD